LPYLFLIDSIAAVTKPLLPAIDVAGQLREAAFALLLRERRPIDLEELARATGVTPPAVRDAVGALGEAGWLDRDDEGRVTGAAGLSLGTGPHALRMAHESFRTWCAYDAIGIPAALGAEAVVETACGQCGAPIRLPIIAGVPERSGPERLWLADGGADLRGSFCTPTVLLCGEVHARAWAAAHHGRGRLLDLAEAARLGGEEWAGCAATFRRLA